MSLREKIAFYLEDLETPLGISINFLILGLIILSSAIFVAETYQIPQGLIQIFHRIDLTILIIFAAEYLVRFWAAEQKFKFFFSFFSLIDLIAVIPLVFGWLDIRFLRILRWFRFLRIIRFLDFEIFVFRIRTQDGIILARIFLILFTIIFIYSGLIYQVEHGTNAASFGNFYDAFYFSIVTMTTVGFGDLTPLSEAGRLVTLLMIITGISVIPWQLGQLVKQLIITANHQLDKACDNCGLSYHENDAIFCRHCGTKLRINSNNQRN